MDKIGKKGLEKLYDKKLQHEDGYRVTIVDDNSNTIAHTLMREKEKRWQRYSTNY